MSNENKKPISARASDLGTLLTTGSTGFAVRKKTGVGLIVHFLLLFCMVVMGTTLLVYYNSPEGCVLAVVVGGVFAVTSSNLEKLKKIKQSLEFMNALFSSSLGKGYQFCFIVKNTGDVIFFNRPFQMIFPAFIKQSDRKIAALFNAYNVPQDQRDTFERFVNGGQDGSMTLNFKESDAPTTSTVTLQIENIDRPTGFFLVRGK